MSLNLNTFVNSGGGGGGGLGGGGGGGSGGNSNNPPPSSSFGNVGNNNNSSTTTTTTTSSASSKKKRKQETKPQSQINKCLNEKRRREQENIYIEELAELISVSIADMSALSVKPDKCAILQETVNQIRRIKASEESFGNLLQVSSYLNASPSPTGSASSTSGGVGSSSMSNSNSNVVVQQGDVSSSTTILANEILCPLVLEALDGFLFVVSTEGRIEYASENVQTFIQFQQSDLQGQSIYTILHPSDHAKFSASLLPISMQQQQQQQQTQSSQPQLSWASDGSNHSQSSEGGGSVASVAASTSGGAKPQRSFNVRVKIKTTSEESAYENMQISAILTPHPGPSEESCLVCIARRLPPNERPPGAPVEQFTTKLLTDGRLIGLDTSGLSSNFSSHLPKDLVGTLLQDLCHPTDVNKLNLHLRDTHSNGSSTSPLYRIKIGEKYIQVQTKSKYFAFNLNAEPDFIMATHTIVIGLEEQQSNSNNAGGVAGTQQVIKSEIIKIPMMSLPSSSSSSSSAQQQLNQDTNNNSDMENFQTFPFHSNDYDFMDFTTQLWSSNVSNDSSEHSVSQPSLNLDSNVSNHQNTSQSGQNQNNILNPLKNTISLSVATATTTTNASSSSSSSSTGMINWNNMVDMGAGTVIDDTCDNTNENGDRLRELLTRNENSNAGVQQENKILKGLLNQDDFETNQIETNTQNTRENVLLRLLSNESNTIPNHQSNSHPNTPSSPMTHSQHHHHQQPQQHCHPNSGHHHNTVGVPGGGSELLQQLLNNQQHDVQSNAAASNLQEQRNIFKKQLLEEELFRQSGNSKSNMVNIPGELCKRNPRLVSLLSKQPVDNTSIPQVPPSLLSASPQDKLLERLKENHWTQQQQQAALQHHHHQQQLRQQQQQHQQRPVAVQPEILQNMPSSDDLLDKILDQVIDFVPDTSNHSTLNSNNINTTSTFDETLLGLLDGQGGNSTGNELAMINAIQKELMRYEQTTAVQSMTTTFHAAPPSPNPMSPSLAPQQHQAIPPQAMYLQTPQQTPNQQQLQTPSLQTQQPPPVYIQRTTTTTTTMTRFRPPMPSNLASPMSSSSSSPQPPGPLPNLLNIQLTPQQHQMLQRRKLQQLQMQHQLQNMTPQQQQAMLQYREQQQQQQQQQQNVRVAQAVNLDSLLNNGIAPNVTIQRPSGPISSNEIPTVQQMRPTAQQLSSQHLQQFSPNMTRVPSYIASTIPTAQAQQSLQLQQQQQQQQQPSPTNQRIWTQQMPARNVIGISTSVQQQNPMLDAQLSRGTAQQQIRHQQQQQQQQQQYQRQQSLEEFYNVAAAAANGGGGPRRGMQQSTNQQQGHDGLVSPDFVRQELRNMVGARSMSSSTAQHMGVPDFEAITGYQPFLESQSSPQQPSPNGSVGSGDNLKTQHPHHS